VRGSTGRWRGIPHPYGGVTAEAMSREALSLHGKQRLLPDSHCHERSKTISIVEQRSNLGVPDTPRKVCVYSGIQKTGALHSDSPSLCRTH